MTRREPDTTTETRPPPLAAGEAELDRLRELTSIGAGRAANAFAQLAGRTVRIRVPQVIGLEAHASDWSTGVLFEVEGSLTGVMGILFHRASRKDVARRLLGPNPPAAQMDSALQEVGNILVSHVVSAIADTLGARILPSPPELVAGDALRAWGERARGAGAGDTCIATELVADGGGLETLVVFAPVPSDAERPSGRSDTLGG